MLEGVKKILDEYGRARNAVEIFRFLYRMLKGVLKIIVAILAFFTARTLTVPEWQPLYTYLAALGAALIAVGILNGILWATEQRLLKRGRLDVESSSKAGTGTEAIAERFLSSFRAKSDMVDAVVVEDVRAIAELDAELPLLNIWITYKSFYIYGFAFYKVEGPLFLNTKPASPLSRGYQITKLFDMIEPLGRGQMIITAGLSSDEVKLIRNQWTDGDRISVNFGSFRVMVRPEDPRYEQKVLELRPIGEAEIEKPKV